MSDITWKELAEKIAQMTPDQRQTNVTVKDACSMEYYPMQRLCEAEDISELDDGHPFLVFNMF